MTEEWKPVQLNHFSSPNYEISSEGRVRRIAPGLGTFCGRVLVPKPCPTRNGVYLKVWLYSGGKCFPRFVHRLVAAAFVENPALKPEVNHIDCDTLNNKADNLEWATRQEQEAHKRFMEA